MSHKSNYSKHHHIPRKYKDWFENPADINSKENTSIIKDSKHWHVHWLYWADTPAMSVTDDIIFNLKIFTEKFARDMLKVLKENYWEYYKVKVHIQEEMDKIFELEKILDHMYKHGKSI